MIKFLITGLLRDRHRSLLPLIVTATGVMLTVIFHAWITGVIGNSIEFNARFSAGHVKTMNRAYSQNLTQRPNDLAIMGTDSITRILSEQFPSMEFAERIYFAGLIDVPDEMGETKSQGPALGIAIDMLSGNPAELERMNIPGSLKSGHLPNQRMEALLSRTFSEKLGIALGDTITLVSSSMLGELAMYNFILCGTVEFGTTALDRGTIIADIQDVREALNMADATGEIVGFFRTQVYNDEDAQLVVSKLNQMFFSETDEFSLITKSLKDQNNMAFLVEYSSKLKGLLVFVFILAMSIILWNAGLLGGIRRYGEFGMRLAIGEEKRQVYRSMLAESLIIGIAGSFVGVVVGLGIAWYLQTYGIDMGIMMKNATIMMPQVFKAQITPETWYIGFVPGVLSSQLGTMLAGLGIYKRQTAQLFKELEA
jgi:putative ABC transport system permease protein